MRPYYVYAVENILNNKIYVGQSVDVRRRWSKHKSDAKRIKLPFYYALNKYGFDNFIVYILEVTFDNKINDAERFWIKKLNTLNPKFGYNLEEGGQDYHEFSEAHRKAISIANTGKNNGMFGKTHSQEARDKMRKSHIGSKASEETRKKQSIAHQNCSDEYRENMRLVSIGKRRGEKSGTAKLNNEKVIEIRRKAANGMARKNLAKEYNVTKSNIDQIINRKTWKDV